MRPISFCIVALTAGLIGALACGGANRGQAPPPPIAERPAAPAAAPATAPDVAPVAAPSPLPDVVRVSRTTGLAGGLQLAIARGRFQEQGIDLQEVDFPSTAEAVPALATGDLDAGSATPNASFFNALGRGIRLYPVLAGSHVDRHGNGFPLMVRAGPDGPLIHELVDLRGKRIAQNQRGVINEWALDRMLAEVGLRTEDVETIVMPFPDALAGFGGGSVDASILPEPFGTIGAVRGLAVRLMDADEYIAGGQVAVMVYSEAFARQRTAVGRRWAVAYLQGVRDFMDAMEYGRDRESVVAILAQAAGLDAQLVERMGYFPVRRDGRVSVDGLQAMLDWLVQRAYVPHRPDLNALLDDQFAAYAVQTLDTPATATP
jgi:NitT/TauT family transport system substrate-binding protein